MFIANRAQFILSVAVRWCLVAARINFGLIPSCHRTDYRHIHPRQPSCQIKWHFNEPCDLIRYNLQNLDVWSVLLCVLLQPGHSSTVLQILLWRILCALQCNISTKCARHKSKMKANYGLVFVLSPYSWVNENWDFLTENYVFLEYFLTRNM